MVGVCACRTHSINKFVPVHTRAIIPDAYTAVTVVQVITVDIDIFTVRCYRVINDVSNRSSQIVVSKTTCGCHNNADALGELLILFMHETLPIPVL